MKQIQSHKCDELEIYRQAVWDFMLEHCDVTERGSYFIKFHIDGRSNFENRIKGRWKYDYHRVDARTGFDNAAKEADATKRKTMHQDLKKMKREQYILSRQKQKAALAALKLEQEKLAFDKLPWYQKLLTKYPV